MKSWLKVDSFVLVVCTLSLALQSLLLIYTGTAAGIKLNLVLQLLFLIAFGVWSTRVTNSLLNAPFVFVLSIYFWHSTFVTPHFLSANPKFEFTGNIFSFGERFVPQSIGFIGLCLVCSVLGATGARGRLLRRISRKGGGLAEVADTPVQRPVTRSVRRAVWCSFAIFVIIQASYMIIESPIVFGGSYMSLYIEEPDSLIYRIFQSLKFMGVPIILLVFASASNQIEKRIAFLVSAALIILNLMMGSRSIPFIYGMALLVCVDRFYWRIPFLVMGVIAASGMALSFIVDHSRGYGLGLQVFDLSQSGRSVDFLHIFSNAGGVIRNVLRTMEFSEGHLWWGRSFADSVIYLLPRVVVDSVGLGSGTLRPCDWLIAASNDVQLGEGLGYSLVAEAYLNFGYYGCFLFAAIGGVIGHLFFSFQLHNNRMAWVNAYIIAVTLCLHMRNDSATYFRVIFYGLLLTTALMLKVRRTRPPRPCLAVA